MKSLVPRVKPRPVSEKVALKADLTPEKVVSATMEEAKSKTVDREDAIAPAIATPRCRRAITTTTAPIRFKRLLKMYATPRKPDAV
jgi:hypothetical protein